MLWRFAAIGLDDSSCCLPVALRPSSHLGDVMVQQQLGLLEDGKTTKQEILLGSESRRPVRGRENFHLQASIQSGTKPFRGRAREVEPARPLGCAQWRSDRIQPGLAFDEKHNFAETQHATDSTRSRDAEKRPLQCVVSFPRRRNLFFPSFSGLPPAQGGTANCLFQQHAHS